VDKVNTLNFLQK